MVTRGARVAGVVAVVGLGLALVGCAPAAKAPATGSAPVPGPVATAAPAAGANAPPPGMTIDDGFGIADVVFLQQMIPHHELALRMAELATTRASSPEIDNVAWQLEVEYAEVQKMSDWLSSLGMDPRLAAFGGHNHGGGPTEQDLANLANLSGVAFDDSFLDLMIRHSLGATELARAEAQQGRNGGARRLAAQIATRESHRIITLHRLR